MHFSTRWPIQTRMFDTTQRTILAHELAHRLWWERVEMEVLEEDGGANHASGKVDEEDPV